MAKGWRGILGEGKGVEALEITNDLIIKMTRYLNDSLRIRMTLFKRKKGCRNPKVSN